MGISNHKLQSRLKPITSILITISFLLFVTLLIIIFFLTNRFVRPLKKLSLMVEKLAGGDYSVRSDINSGDEIGKLSRDFNLMADKINDQILSIARYSRNLEEMVKERTKELKEALESIQDKEEKINQIKYIRSLNTLVTAIAHEINNPMAIISGNIQMIESEPNQADLIDRRLKVIIDAIKRIDALINDINFLSTIKDITIFHFSFSNLLTRIIKEIVPEDIRVVIEGSGDDSINSNQNLISVCLENIIKNAVDIIQKKRIKGMISIKYHWTDTQFIIIIEDNGGGIEEMDKIYEPFYTTYAKKRGLGLTFVFHAVQALSGEIFCENTHLGAQFTLKFPRLVAYS